MPTLTLQAKQAKLAKIILNTDNEDILNELLNTLERLTSKMPCTYSEEEICAGAKRVIAAYNSGNKKRFTSQEDLEKKHPL